ncbi:MULTISPECIES: glycosyltransferase [unclassified Bacillus (in: firmicutes)]|uniref:glycosyltransferase n=1 Tax=unclassified Bacillus (in: firmicutes) TaxID=185979 RepID=UPI0020362434|nr:MULTISPECIES: glycosyltransferase [unclassified Bacillus (in: firmicutes)]
MKIALLTMFNGLDSSYSLVNVVAEQVRMLLDANIETRILVSDICPLNKLYGIFLDKRIKWVKICNHLEGKQMHWKNYIQSEGEVHDTFFNEADVIAEDLVKKLADIDICFMHDIHYQGWHLHHNIAIRKVQEKLTNLKFLAFTHSAPVKRPPNPKWPFSARFTPMPNTLYIYPTQSGISALAKQYNVPEDRCKVVNNSLDLLGFVTEEVNLLSKYIDLLTPDILVVYPGRLTRAKKFDKVAALCGAIKVKTSKLVKVIFCDTFPKLDTSPEAYKEFVRSIGVKFGLNDGDLLFTSDIKEFNKGLPRKSVLELFTLSNLFICPSYSESFGLTVLEAASRGNFLVLNEQVPALNELGSQLDAYFMKWDAKNFGFNTREIYRPSEEAYLTNHADNIIKLMDTNSVIHAKIIAKQRYSPKWIWKNQLEPIIKSLC